MVVVIKLHVLTSTSRTFDVQNVKKNLYHSFTLSKNTDTLVNLGVLNLTDSKVLSEPRQVLIELEAISVDLKHDVFDIFLL